MNRALLITIGIAVIIVVFLLWLWLFFNSTPTTSQEIFSDLGITENPERPEAPLVPSELGENNNTVLNLSDNRLQQVTVAPIAGFRVASTSVGTLLRYVERGTGHVYEVNLTSGLQTQVSPNTLPSAVDAVFSPDLEQVVVVTDHNSRAVTLITLPNERRSESTQLALDNRAEQLQFLNNRELTYTLNSYTDTKSYVLNLEDNTVSNRFTVPLPDAVIKTLSTNKTIAYPKASTLLGGALYAVADGQLTPLSTVRRGLVAFVSNAGDIISAAENGRYASYQLPGKGSLAFLMLPEKCAASTNGEWVWCGVATNAMGDRFLENWYKGTWQSDDVLWSFNTLTRDTQQLAAPKDETGRQVDVTEMASGPHNERLFFINKIDSTLWSLGLNQ